MNEFEALNITDSEDDEGAGERVKSIMEEIIRNQDKIKTDKDIDDMAERCTSMLTQMRNEAHSKKKDKRPHRATGSGDKASPPPSRLSSVKESPRKDSTKPSPIPRMPSQLKSSLKEQTDSKKKPRPNFAEMYKEKMEKLRAHGEMDLTGSKTKSDSTKPLKSKVGMGTRWKQDKVVEEISSETESESSSGASDSESSDSDEIENDTYEQLIKEMKSRDTIKGSKESEAHKKTAEWMSSTRGEQIKKKESAGTSSKGPIKKPLSKPLMYSSSSDLDSEDDEKLAQQLKAKLTKAAKNAPPEKKDAMRKIMSSIIEAPTKAPAVKATVAPLRRTGVPGSGGPKVSVVKPGPSGDKAKPKKK